MKIIKITLIIFAVFVLIIVAIIGEGVFSQREEYAVGNRNMTNAQKVELGMDTVEVIRIMGVPPFRNEFRNSFIYSYDVPPASSYSCQFEFNEKGELISISGDIQTYKPIDMNVKKGLPNAL